MRNECDITIVLDRSGSMDSVRQDTIGGYNSFLKAQKEDPIPTRMSLVQFDNLYEPVYEGKWAKDVDPLSSDTYVPRGATALLDAIGRTIDSTGKRLAAMPEADRPSKVIFVIITDGHENASMMTVDGKPGSARKYPRERIFQMVTHQQEAYGWQFVFLGANMDAMDEGPQLGIPMVNSLSTASNPISARASYAHLGANVNRYKSGIAADMSWTSEEREEQKKSGAKN